MVIESVNYVETLPMELPSSHIGYSYSCWLERTSSCRAQQLLVVGQSTSQVARTQYGRKDHQRQILKHSDVSRNCLLAVAGYIRFSLTQVARLDCHCDLSSSFIASRKLQSKRRQAWKTSFERAIWPAGTSDIIKMSAISPPRSHEHLLYLSRPYLSHYSLYTIHSKIIKGSQQGQMDIWREFLSVKVSKLIEYPAPILRLRTDIDTRSNAISERYRILSYRTRTWIQVAEASKSCHPCSWGWLMLYIYPKFPDLLITHSPGYLSFCAVWIFVSYSRTRRRHSLGAVLSIQILRRNQSPFTYTLGHTPTK